MAPRAAAFVFLAALLAAQALPTFVPPHYCHELDCPEFEVHKPVGRDGELRTYAPATWVSTDVKEATYEKATALGFQRLFKYLLGYNELEEQIEMTTPVVTQVRLTEDDEFKDDYTVSLFLPLEYQQNQGDEDFVAPPGPKDEDVELTEVDETEVYVLPFGFYAIGIRAKELALGFMDYLERNGFTDVDHTKFWVAQYDPPYKPFDRHNEIWVLRKAKGKGGGGGGDSGAKPRGLWPDIHPRGHEEKGQAAPQAQQAKQAQQAQQARRPVLLRALPELLRGAFQRAVV